MICISKCFKGWREEVVEEEEEEEVEVVAEGRANLFQRRCNGLSSQTGFCHPQDEDGDHYDKNLTDKYLFSKVDIYVW